MGALRMHPHTVVLGAARKWLPLETEPTAKCQGVEWGGGLAISLRVALQRFRQKIIVCP